MKDIASPNFNDRAPGISLEYVVLHYTGMENADVAIKRLCDPAAQVSAHYVIDEDGKILRLVDETKRAWHAGKSFWRGVSDINSASIGIELVNPGHEFGYRPFPDLQIKSLGDLLRDIFARHKLSPTQSLLAHSDVAPHRKQDPGEFFPWHALAAEGFGFWPDSFSKEEPLPADEEIASMLALIGYDTSVAKDALIAFQRRYNPQTITGVIDRETASKLSSVLAFYKEDSSVI